MSRTLRTPPEVKKRPPHDFDFRFTNEVEKTTGHIGRAWFTEDGHVDIVLNAKVHISKAFGEQLFLIPTEDFRKRFAAKKD